MTYRNIEKSYDWYIGKEFRGHKFYNGLKALTAFVAPVALGLFLTTTPIGHAALVASVVLFGGACAIYGLDRVKEVINLNIAHTFSYNEFKNADFAGKQNIVDKQKELAERSGFNGTEIAFKKYKKDLEPEIQDKKFSYGKMFDSIFSMAVSIFYRSKPKNNQAVEISRHCNGDSQIFSPVDSLNQERQQEKAERFNSFGNAFSSGDSQIFSHVGNLKKSSGVREL